MPLTKRQRKMLSDLCSVCNTLGNELDGTATSNQKYIDRQRAHRKVYTALYGIICDEVENDQREHDIEKSEKAINELRELAKKTYPDKIGYLNFGEHE